MNMGFRLKNGDGFIWKRNSLMRRGGETEEVINVTREM